MNVVRNHDRWMRWWIIHWWWPSPTSTKRVPIVVVKTPSNFLGWSSKSACIGLLYRWMDEWHASGRAVMSANLYARPTHAVALVDVERRSRADNSGGPLWGLMNWPGWSRERRRQEECLVNRHLGVLWPAKDDRNTRIYVDVLRLRSSPTPTVWRTTRLTRLASNTRHGRRLDTELACPSAPVLVMKAWVG